MNFKDIRESFRNKQISAKELTQDSLDKAKRYSNLNAFISNFDEDAIEEYREWRTAMEEASVARGEKARQQKREQQAIKNDVDSLKDDVTEIKSLLKDL